MLQWPKLPWLLRTTFVLRCQLSLHELDCKLYHHRVSKDGDVDDKSDKFRSSGENRECQFQLHKSKGQHLLTSARVLDSIVKNSNVKPSDTVLEIGPGTGNLTLRLLEAASKVVAVEIDSRMAEALQKRVAQCEFEDRLTVRREHVSMIDELCRLIRKDALKAEFPPFDLVVANIPYGISSPLIAKLLFGAHSFRSATLLLQKEFARRLLANPGDSEFNRLAVNVKLVAEVKLIMDVSKRDFFPAPKVDSSVVLITPKANIPAVDLKEWCAFTRTCFCKKNKTLGATFKQKKKLIELMRISSMMDVNRETLTLPHSSDSSNEYNVDDDGLDVSLHTGISSFKEKVIGILRSSGFEDKRPSKLSIDELLHLLSLFNDSKIYFLDKEDDASNTELFTSFDL